MWAAAMELSCKLLPLEPSRKDSLSTLLTSPTSKSWLYRYARMEKTRKPKPK